MRLRIEHTRTLQVGLLLLLGVSFAQVLWWILDESNYTRNVVAREEERVEAQARAARAMLAMDVPAERIRALWPDLSVEGRTIRVSDATVAALRDEREHRLNRYGWEGTFFLVVLLVGMGILGQTLKREFELKRRLQNFLAAVSHEFKSPIASLRLSAETIALRDPPAEKRRSLVRRMLDELQRLETMVLNLLDTGRIDEGRIPYDPERVRIKRLADAIVDEMGEYARTQKVELVSEIQEDVEIRVDPAAARTVLRNLVDNAIKATAAADGGRVTLRATPRDGRVDLEVIDTGIGIPSEELERIFEKFYRPGDELRRKSRGSGLGLYLVQRFVELGRGSVHARSAGPGKGAVLTVSWPIEREAGT